MKLLIYLENLTSLDSFYLLSEKEKRDLLDYSRLNIPYDQSRVFDNEVDENYLIRNHHKWKLVAPSTRSLLLLLHYYRICCKNFRYFYADGFSNIWIIKSNHSSRGRNIKLVDSLEQI